MSWVDELRVGDKVCREYGHRRRISIMRVTRVTKASVAIDAGPLIRKSSILRDADMRPVTPELHEAVRIDDSLDAELYSLYQGWMSAEYARPGSLKARKELLADIIKYRKAEGSK